MAHRPSFLQRFLLLTNIMLLSAVAALVADRGVAPPATAAQASLADGFVPKSRLAAVVHEVSPAVVTVGAVRTSYRRGYDFFRPYVQRSVERLPYLGSGVIVSDEGHVVTNVHVIEGAEEIFVTLPDGRELPARLLSAEGALDIAILKVEAEGLPKPLDFGDSDDLQPGEEVAALGNPFGPMVRDPRPTVTAGVVSATQRSFQPEGGRVFTDMIQTDAAINPGNSGGPLVDSNGRLIGINTFIFSRSGGSQGIGFAIPVNRVRRVLEEVREFGGVRTRLLDFDMEGVLLRTGNQRETGVLITELAPGGPADRAGLVVGDVIVQAEGKAMARPDDLVTFLRARQAGDRLRLGIWRSGQRFEVDYEVTAAPAKGRRKG
ncbi:MAG: trypsin-like peptidase domain-containing protein [Candidatus Sumerlaeia bacterium]|nr:trypsin-like peptidase domain-containing protein [Candidatus Sumerlaeia bacterium]